MAASTQSVASHSARATVRSPGCCTFLLTHACCSVFGISVYGWGGPSTFTISASTSNSTTLVPDYPAQGFAPAWTFAYYVFYNTGA